MAVFSKFPSLIVGGSKEFTKYASKVNNKLSVNVSTHVNDKVLTRIYVNNIRSDRYYVTEKVHGSCIGFYVDVDGITVLSRNNLLETEDELKHLYRIDNFIPQKR